MVKLNTTTRYYYSAIKRIHTSPWARSGIRLMVSHQWMVPTWCCNSDIADADCWRFFLSFVIYIHVAPMSAWITHPCKTSSTVIQYICITLLERSFIQIGSGCDRGSLRTHSHGKINWEWEKITSLPNWDWWGCHIDGDSIRVRNLGMLCK